MIETNAFLVMFAAQILAMSVLHPALLIRYTRAKAADYPPERFPEMDWGVLGKLSTQRFCTLYRAANTVIALIGALVLAWLLSNMQRPDLDTRVPIVVTGLYFILQTLPLLLMATIWLRYFRMLRTAAREPRRKAVLQRRGLFDFISPFSIGIAVFTFLLFVAFMIYVSHFRAGPFHGTGGYLMLGFFTLMEALGAFRLYRLMYGRKLNPVETHAERVRTIGLAVKVQVYSSIATHVFIPALFTFLLLDLSRWMPLVLSTFLVIMALLICTPFSASYPTRADGLGESPVA